MGIDIQFMLNQDSIVIYASFVRTFVDMKLATVVKIVYVIIFSDLDYPRSVDAICPKANALPNATDLSVGRIFETYGQIGPGNVTIINATGVTNLLKALSLDKIKVVCEDDDKECKKASLHFLKDTKDPLQSRRRRSVESDKHDAMFVKQKSSCTRVRTYIDSNFGIKSTAGMKKADFLNVCPLLVESVSGKTCVHYHKRYPEFEHPDEAPNATQKWTYGVIAITICSLLSLVVIAMIPCLHKSFYDKLMAYLVAMAVGTLCGDALLHLIPHAFIEGANLAAGIEVSEEQEEKQHYSQVYRALIVMAGIYLFFMVEQFMKLRASWSKRHSHNHDGSDKEMVQNELKEAGEIKTQDGVLVEGAAVHSHGPSGHAHSHGDKEITGKTNISSVAWMVVVGDGFHNFSDGLAVGAAFSASISSGISTTIAIFCHELPHELGDFAVLLKAGMTAKQAIVYNLVGALLSYIGLVIGILAGTNELGRHVILCLTAGLFFYVSLVNMMTEVVGTENDIFRAGTVICQHLGMLSGIAIMLVISLYEHDM